MRAYDFERIHFVEGDTDSMYWAIAGNPNGGVTQDFDEVIKDRKFYDENVYEFLPDNRIENLADRKKHEKKLLGLCVEKRGNQMVALAPKVYTISNEANTTCKVKGVSKNRNKDVIKPENYYAIVTNEKALITGRNMSLQMKKYGMSKIEQLKVALSGAHTKMRVSDDGSTCLPFHYKPDVLLMSGNDLVELEE